MTTPRQEDEDDDEVADDPGYAFHLPTLLQELPDGSTNFMMTTQFSPSKKMDPSTISVTEQVRDEIAPVSVPSRRRKNHARMIPDELSEEDPDARTQEIHQIKNYDSGNTERYDPRNGQVPRASGE